MRWKASDPSGEIYRIYLEDGVTISQKLLHSRKLIDIFLASLANTIFEILNLVISCQKYSISMPSGQKNPLVSLADQEI